MLHNFIILKLKKTCSCPLVLLHNDVTTNSFLWAWPAPPSLSPSPFQLVRFKQASPWEGRRNQLVLPRGETWETLRKSPTAEGAGVLRVSPPAPPTEARRAKEAAPTSTESRRSQSSPTGPAKALSHSGRIRAAAEPQLHRTAGTQSTWMPPAEPCRPPWPD